ncbi:hypothetical protein F542_21340 [Bibersteinia trehalosi USDA-ARS-USMARC-188]|uniref:Uncharacterized protein n=3 Tax=Bibersteinia trehalosi TaxID=47735 RepID=W0R2D0_BIBTR|nr:hypothetical protein WQG_230 [Bibersteinia trehalosi USDA-ARS-USMARC-192]AHG82842.1 hypothetical protein F542_21340 [Bibersteinia trehalosi USDA-ARS-USMARC-188]AHG85216.1 hypothetical protein F543_23620 [Bibersteinia trehalosi USDA-ARS-USMARC-189]AHG85264.1 hypothetical protein F544_270 [Bibersteinia trehalosi USDA-ARS-USMARC-190]
MDFVFFSATLTACDFQLSHLFYLYWQSCKISKTDLLFSLFFRKNFSL